MGSDVATVSLTARAVAIVLGAGLLAAPFIVPLLLHRYRRQVDRFFDRWIQDSADRGVMGAAFWARQESAPTQHRIALIVVSFIIASVLLWPPSLELISLAFS